MRRVSLLPKKLGGSKKGSGPHLPAQNICPLIDLERQISVFVVVISANYVQWALRESHSKQEVSVSTVGSPRKKSDIRITCHFSKSKRPTDQSMNFQLLVLTCDC